MALRAHPDSIELAIEDDGAGFDVPSKDAMGPPTSFGMTGMAEPASLVDSELKIRSAPARGTVVSVRIGRQEPEATA